MPQRMVDGNAWARSKKIRDGVEEKYRRDYCLWLTLAEANGTFECDVERIHADLYAYMIPSIKLRHVQEMLEQFVRAGVLATWEDEKFPGKTWGFFVGSDKPGRLPARAHLNRYKDLPPSYPGLLPDESGESPKGFGIGKERNGKERKGASAPLLDFAPKSEIEKEREMKARKFAEKCVPIWQAIYGKGALLRFPERSKDELSFLTETAESDLLLQAFEMWAKERYDNGETHDPWAIGKFVSRASDYMLKIAPVPVNHKRDDMIQRSLAKAREDHMQDYKGTETEEKEYNPMEGVE